MNEQTKVYNVGDIVIPIGCETDHSKDGLTNYNKQSMDKYVGHIFIVESSPGKDKYILAYMDKNRDVVKFNSRIGYFIWRSEWLKSARLDVDSWSYILLKDN